MSRQQVDKSRDQMILSPILTLQTQAHCQKLAEDPFKHLPSSPNYFDKFKSSNYVRTSCFRLIKSQASHSVSGASKKSEIIRKYRGNYRKYTVAEKQEAVKQILQGVDAKEISDRYGIPRRNLLRWKKNGCERKEGGGRPTDGEMERTLYTKIENKILTNEKQIREQAKNLSKLADFKASKGWYCKFSRRYNQWKRQKGVFEQINGITKPQQGPEVLLPEISQDYSESSGSEKDGSGSNQVSI